MIGLRYREAFLMSPLARLGDRASQACGNEGSNSDNLERTHIGSNLMSEK
jgi:hypothetical protein